MKDIFFLTEEMLNLLELKEDSLFHKIPKAKVRYYIEEARDIGRKEAVKYKNEDIEYLLREKNVEVIIKEKSPTKNLDLRGEIIFDKKERKIIIYKDSMDQIIETLKEAGFNISKGRVYNIHLAHEFYHFLEYSNNKNTNEQLDKIEIDIIGNLIKRKATILKTREIAAHAFCKEILNLKIHPKLLDYVYLIKNKKINLNEFKSYIKELERVYLK